MYDLRFKNETGQDGSSKKQIYWERGRSLRSANVSVKSPIIDCSLYKRFSPDLSLHAIYLQVLLNGFKGFQMFVNGLFEGNSSK